MLWVVVPTLRPPGAVRGSPGQSFSHSLGNRRRILDVLWPTLGPGRDFCAWRCRGWRGRVGV